MKYILAISLGACRVQAQSASLGYMPGCPGEEIWPGFERMAGAVAPYTHAVKDLTVFINVWLSSAYSI